MQASWRDLEILVKTVYGEARGEPRVGKQAVAWVILNRLDANRWYSAPTIEEVCRKPYQFSCWNDGDPMRRRIEGLGPLRAGNCLEAALDVLLRGAPDPTAGATFYLNPEATLRIRADGKLPQWALVKPAVRIIGRHHFFRDPDL